MAPRKTATPKRQARQVQKAPVVEKFITISEAGYNGDLHDTLDAAKEHIKDIIDEDEVYYVGKVILEAKRVQPPVTFTDFK